MQAARTLKELVEAGAGELKWSEGGARENPRREASLLLQAAVGLDRNQMVIHGDQTAAPGAAARYWEMVRRRARGLPLQLLVGHSGFHDVTLAVEPGVFIPRPETESLVEQAVRGVEAALAADAASSGDVAAAGPAFRADTRVTVLDLCTGTGAVAVAVAHRFRREERVSVHAGDWSLRAVRLARRNAESNEITVDVRRSDLFSAFADLEGRVNVLAANPPYIARAERESLPVEVRLGDPEDALFDPDGGTGFHRRIAGRGRDFLRAGGVLAVEIGDRQGDEVSALLHELEYEDVAVLRDLAGRDRVVRGRRPR
ncbi:MAG TPA: peptide chain release factor N(5)-glutamine methyltransferase [bacterium]|nr:peptide chain release factor N(5)-glutamine methyltransferase [bacterium]